MSPEPKDVLHGLKTQHPRLIFTAKRQQQIKQLTATDDFARSIADDTIEIAEAMLTDEPVSHIMIGRRLLAQSRKALSHITHTAAAFILTGRQEFADSCRREMLAAAAMKDWSPSHFLDTAEMATALSLGTDWIYEQLSDGDRQTIVTALIEKALKPSISQDPHGWVNSENNWNQVCNTGMALAAITIAHQDAELAAAIIARSINGVPNAMDPYLPEGAYPEGPMYWGYGTSYNCILIDALNTAFGHNFKLDEHAGFSQTLQYRRLMVAPDHSFYTYSDSRDHETPGEAQLWFADHYDSNEYTDGIIREISHIRNRDESTTEHRKTWRFWPLLLSWYAGRSDSDAAELPLKRVYQGGKMPVGVFRSAHSDDALWLGFKGGDIPAGHSQMDHGSFSVVADGVRWIHDLGCDDYSNLEIIGGLWDPKYRFEFFRYASWGHSMLRIGDNNLNSDSNRAEITCVYNDASRSSAIVDLDQAWSHMAAGAKRGYAMLDGKSILVQDEITDPADELIWQVIVPKCDIEIQAGRAVLTTGDKSFAIESISHPQAEFKLRDATPAHELEDQNEQFARLYFTLPKTAGTTTIAVQMHPGSTNPDKAAITALSNWPS